MPYRNGLRTHCSIERRRKVVCDGRASFPGWPRCAATLGYGTQLLWSKEKCKKIKLGTPEICQNEVWMQ